MLENLSLDRLIKELKLNFEKFPDVRTDNNRQYEIGDAGLGAFSPNVRPFWNTRKRWNG